MQFKIDQKYYPYSRYSIVGISGHSLTYSASIVFKGPTALPHTHLSFGATCPPPPLPNSNQPFFTTGLTCENFNILFTTFYAVLSELFQLKDVSVLDNSYDIVFYSSLQKS